MKHNIFVKKLDRAFFALAVLNNHSRNITVKKSGKDKCTQSECLALGYVMSGQYFK